MNTVAAMHPADVELDRLRAGLLDENPSARTALQTHLRECEVCRARTAPWAPALKTLDRASAERGLAGRLQARRQRALRGVAADSYRRKPMMYALAAAITAVAIGVGAFLANDRDTGGDTVVVEGPSQDLYADIDFYLWLMEKHESEDASPHS